MIDTQSIRSKILDLAMRGQLTEQLPEDGSAEELYNQIQAEKQDLIKAGKIKKEKQLPANTEEVPYSIPANWKWVSIGSILTLQSGKNMVSSQITDSPDENHMFPCYGGNGQRGFVSYANTDGFHAIIGRQGALCGNINFAKGPFYATEHAVVVYEYAGTDMSWVGLTLRFLNLNQYATSVAQPGLAVNKINTVLMPLPPIAEQQRIVAKIEQIFSILDTIDTLQAQNVNNLTVLKSKLFDAAIQGKLTEQLSEEGTAEELYQQIQEEKQKLIREEKIRKEKPLAEITEEEVPFELPENWKWVRLGDISSKIASGNTPSGGAKANVYVSDGYPFFREQNIYNDGIHTVGLVYISEELLATRPNSTVLANDLLLNITGGSIGRCAIVPHGFDKGSVNQHILIIRPCLQQLIKYLHLVICSNYYQKIISERAVGDKDGFSGGRCKQSIIPLPPLAEQQRIVEKLDAILPLIDGLTRTPNVSS